MQTKLLTPALLFLAADLLIHPADPSHGVHRYMCHAVEQAAGRLEIDPGAAVHEFQTVLIEQGVIAFPGDAMVALDPSDPDDGYGDEADRQAVRFTFLEFLAHSLS